MNQRDRYDYHRYTACELDYMANYLPPGVERIVLEGFAVLRYHPMAYTIVKNHMYGHIREHQLTNTTRRAIRHALRAMERERCKCHSPLELAQVMVGMEMTRAKKLQERLHYMATVTREEWERAKAL